MHKGSDIQSPAMASGVPPHIAVIGAGWAGCSAAVHAVQQGARVSLFETGRIAGGRARSVPWPNAPEGTLDNGQHILIGAYAETLALMQTVNADPQTLLQRLPLDLRTPDGCGLYLPATPAYPKLAVLRAIWQAKGWGLREKARFLSTVARWQLQGFACTELASVADICRSLGPQIMQSLIVPLCVAAFNSAPEETSGAVFLRVLHDALLTQPGASDVLLAQIPLGQVLPEVACTWLHAQGARISTGRRIAAIHPAPTGGWQLISNPNDAAAEATAYSHIILACSAWEAARLVQECGNLLPEAQQTATMHWAQQAATLQHRPIATVYAWCPSTACAHLPPMQALQCTSDEDAQFVFHHAHRQNATAETLLAFVISHCNNDRHALEQAARKQAREQLGLPDLRIIQTFIEKRATFLCSPNVARPPMRIAEGLFACGDYVQGPYPATLEGAVRSGKQAACAAINTRNFRDMY